MASVYSQTVQTGHTIYIRYGSTIIGRAQGLDGDRSFGTEGVYEIGSMMPQEHVTNRYEGRMTLERFFVRTSDLAALGLASLGEEVLRREILTIEVVDKYTGNTIRSYHGCTISDYRETFRVNAIAGENASFAYLEATDGSATSSVESAIGDAASTVTSALNSAGSIDAAKS